MNQIASLTPRAAASNDNEEWRNLLQMLPTGVIVIGRRGLVEIANPAAETLLQHPELPQLVGMPWGQVIRTAFRPRQNDGHEISLHNGRLVSLDTRALKGTGQMVVINDLTDTRKLQAEVSQHQRLAGIGRMVASLAHQIRTPLSAAMLYIDNLQKPGLSEDQRQRFTGKVQARLEHLEQQVRDMLVFARGDSRLVDRVSCVELVDQARAAVASHLERTGSVLTVLNDCADAQVICNRDTLVGAMANLINNAIEAVGHNASVQWRLFRDNDRIHFDFQDHGPGVPAEILDQLGEPFLTTKANGTGLGLAVVLSVARQHGGEFTIENTAEGALARLGLPEYSQRRHDNEQ